LRYRGTYPTGYLEWVKPDTTINIIGSPGYPTNIYGSTVSVNGYSLYYDNYVPKTIGGIVAGSTFSKNSFMGTTQSQNWPLTEVLREILYPYIEPVLSLSDNIYAEVNKTSSTILTWSVSTYERNPLLSTTYNITSTSISTHLVEYRELVGTSFSSPTFSAGTSSNYWYLNVVSVWTYV
jgi:hypothetical protein